MNANYTQLMETISSTGDWNDELEAEMKRGVEDFQKTGSY